MEKLQRDALNDALDHFVASAGRHLLGRRFGQFMEKDIESYIDQEVLRAKVIVSGFFARYLPGDELEKHTLNRLEDLNLALVNSRRLLVSLPRFHVRDLIERHDDWRLAAGDWLDTAHWPNVWLAAETQRWAGEKDILIQFGAKYNDLWRSDRQRLDTGDKAVLAFLGASEGVKT